MQESKKYDKIDVYFRDSTMTSFVNGELILTPNNIIILTSKLDSIDGFHKTEGLVFELSRVEKYITYNKK